MKTIEIVQEFNVPLDILLKARQERYKHLDKFPELKNVRIVEEKQDGNILHQVRHIAIGASIPPILAQVLPKGADTLLEESDFYLDTNIHKFTVMPSDRNDTLFRIDGESLYERKDENTSIRKYKINITSKVMFIGGAIEVAIAEIYVNSLKKDQESIKHFIEMLQKEEL